MAKKQEPTFEAALAELEEIVGAMENGQPTLRELMEKYSRGIELADRCQKDLDRAAQTIDLLIDPKDGGEKPFDPRQEA